MLTTPYPRAGSSRLEALRVAVAIALVLIVGADAVGAQQMEVGSRARRSRQQRVASLACDSGWSPPRELRTPAGQRVYVEAPLRIRNAVGTFLIGSPTFVWADSTTFIDETSVRHVGDVGVKLLNDTTAIPLPPLPTAT